MSNETVIKTINLILAPVVMITACGIMLNGLIVRYGWLSDRARSVYQEQLNLQEQTLNQENLKDDRLYHLSHLLPDLLRHHHWVHDALIVIYLSILVFMLDMLTIAFAVSHDVKWLNQFVIVVFLIGVSILMGGIILVAHELRTSHGLMQLEVHQNCQVCKKSHRSGK
jgi:hypothetical protein